MVSVLPCDRHGHVVSAGVRGVFPSILFSGQRYSCKLRLCDDCITELLADRESEWRELTVSDRGPDRTSCARCDVEPGDLKDLSTFWCTVYVMGKYRRDYRSRYCPACSQVLIDTLNMEASTNGSK